MLNKAHRLTTAEFSTHFKSGRRYHTPSLQLIYSPTDTFHGAVVVGKKVYKKAVDRNRLRRQVYSRLYTLVQKNNHTGVYIIIAKPSAVTLTTKTLSEEVAKLIGQVAKTR